MKKILFGLICIIALSISCKKTDTSGCWQCEDNQGNYHGEWCGENEGEAYNKAKASNYGGTIENFRQYCKKK
ncbi:MAG: hypothetical protein IPJ81_16335 [Chitinophagaceae bacterium]|nr:hypothetical protein [Chitinophagaceae bacterium]